MRRALQGNGDHELAVGLGASVRRPARAVGEIVGEPNDDATRANVPDDLPGVRRPAVASRKAGGRWERMGDVPSAFREVAAVRLGDVERTRVYEHGWQSWSPTAAYGVGDRPHRPRNDAVRVMCYRPDRVQPGSVFQGEGLLAVDDGARVHVVGVTGPGDLVPSVRAAVRDGYVVICADGPVGVRVDDGPSGLQGALGRWGEQYAQAAGLGRLRPAPTIWCSWYQYFTKVTEQDIFENLDAMDELALPIDVVQIDDGYQAEIGDWLALSERFPSLAELCARIRDRGRRAGVWTAPLLVGARSRVAAGHPGWLVGGGAGSPLSVGHHWDQDLFVLDVTHPDAAAYLTDVFTTSRGYGIDFFKIDFVFAGAIPGRRYADVAPVESYRQALRLIRGAVGDDAYLLGCGAPMLPSVGLVDAMRVSPDTGLNYEPADGDLSQPSIRAAELTGRWRSWQHGRFWVNDPDCLLARPGIPRREAWAAHVERYGGLRGSSDRLRALDDWGLETTRRLLVPVSATPL
jgi:alpha-galactosidase